MTAAQAAFVAVGDRAFRVLDGKAMKTGPHGITFTASIFPMTLSGHRMRTPRDMLVKVATTRRCDLFTVEVTYVRGAKMITHFYRSSIPTADLAATMVSLDFNGCSVTDPNLDPKG